MSSKPISVQLYSLRDACAEDFDGVLCALAEIGYQGVEPFHLGGMTPQAFKARVTDLGMQISSSHTPWANRNEPQEVIDTISALGLTRAAGGFGPEDFVDTDAIRRTADKVNDLIAVLQPAGIGLFLHNHWWEFEEVDGSPAYYLLQTLCPDVLFEIDTYWAANFGARDPVAEVARVRHRTPLLHIKDGPMTKGDAHVAVGSGKMPIQAIIDAADPDVLEWLIVELDACDTDMLTAVRMSYEYLSSNHTTSE